jgi:hypothetical protein
VFPTKDSGDKGGCNEDYEDPGKKKRKKKRVAS